MNQNHHIQNLRNLNGTVRERSDLAINLFESNQVDTLSLLLEIILNPDYYDTTLDYGMCVEIVQKSTKEREAIVSKIIKEIEESPLSERGNASEYLLGEIVGLQLTIFNQDPNPDIPKILLKAGEDSIAQATTEKLNSLMFALFQYANESPLPEAEFFLRQVLEMSKEENDEDLNIITLGRALDLLYFNNGETFLIEMKELFKNLKEDTELASYIEAFIIEKEEELLEI
jgi:hypothetical protein